MDVNTIMAKRRMMKAKKDNKAIVKKHHDWKMLTPAEKKQIRKDDIWGMTIYKNVFPGWDNVDISLFVTDELQDEILLPKLNKINYTEIGMRHKKNLFQDKNYQPYFAYEMQFPASIIHCVDGEFYDKDCHLIDVERANRILTDYEKVVFKKSIFSGHGEGVKLCEKNEYSQMIRNWERDGNYVVQEVVSQCNEFALLNDSSVNVVRMTTLFWDGIIYVLGGILRVGAPGSFCDHLGYNGINPRIIGIQDDGILYDYSIDPDGEMIYEDCYGKKTGGLVVPKYDEMKNIAKKVHEHYPHNRIIGWDFTVDRNHDVICIEYNPDQPGIIQTQMAVGPIFSVKTRHGGTILHEIINR